MTFQSSLLEPDFLRLLERLEVLSRRSSSSRAPGERRSRSKGRSVEFAEHRDYAAGDDFRTIDWNVYARLEKLFVKLFVEEREQTITVLVDRSQSMAGHKFLFARRLAAALAYVGLCSYDRVALGLLGERLEGFLPPVRGRRQALPVFRFLEQAGCQGRTDLAASLTDFGRRFPRPGTVLVISDFLQEGAGIEGLRFLRYQKNQLFVLQVLARDELEPELAGDVKLVDVETAEQRELTVTESVLRAYRAALDALCQELGSWCRKSGAGYHLAPSDTDLERLLVRTLRASGLLR
ncbi:MAG: DUF58 domain-containing protein [Armatimonadetes bacterium]|nr:DUF58 domain-containing protein [Armatimonadota bacterium]